MGCQRQSCSTITTQVPAVTLAGRGQAGQLLRDRDGPAGAVLALLADLARPQRAGRQGDRQPGLALLRPRGTAAVRTLVLLGDEIDPRGRPADERGPGDPVATPARLAGLLPQPRQQAADPLFRRSGGARSARRRPPGSPCVGRSARGWLPAHCAIAVGLPLPSAARPDSAGTQPVRQLWIEGLVYARYHNRPCSQSEPSISSPTRGGAGRDHARLVI